MTPVGVKVEEVLEVEPVVRARVEHGECFVGGLNDPVGRVMELSNKEEDREQVDLVGKSGEEGTKAKLGPARGAGEEFFDRVVPRKVLGFGANEETQVFAREGQLDPM